jgi:hypothetical protein
MPREPPEAIEPLANSFAARHLLHGWCEAGHRREPMASTIGWLGVMWLGLLSVQDGYRQRVIDDIKPVTLTATIEKVDPATRTVTMKGEKGHVIEVTAPESMPEFKTLKVGEVVTATYYAAVAVQIRRPGEPAPPTDPVVTTQRKERIPGSESRRQQTFTVTVEAIDVPAATVRVKGPRGNLVDIIAADPNQLKTLKVSDKIDVTYYESLLVQVKRAK